ncbi:MAG: hypothetical protein B6D68_01835, partial [spirochete symbiont of Stewartia floridana]
MGLPCHTVGAARRATDKTIMRRCFQQAGIPSPPFVEVGISTNIDSIANEISPPWVVKPSRQHGLPRESRDRSYAEREDKKTEIPKIPRNSRKRKLFVAYAQEENDIRKKACRHLDSLA